MKEINKEFALKRIENSINFNEIKFRKANGEYRTGHFKKYKSRTKTKKQEQTNKSSKEFHSIKDNALTLLIEKDTNKIVNIKIDLITHIKIANRWIEVI